MHHIRQGLPSLLSQSQIDLIKWLGQYFGFQEINGFRAKGNKTTSWHSAVVQKIYV